MSLIDLIDKTPATISDVAFKDKITESYWQTKVGDQLYGLTETQVSQSVQPVDFSGGISAAFTRAVTDKIALEIPVGSFDIDAELSTDQTQFITIKGVASTNTRDATFGTGPNLNVNVVGAASCGLRLGNPAFRATNFTMTGNSANALEALLCIDRNRTDTTLGNWHVENVHVRDSGGTGIKVKAPDNGSLLIHSSANYNQEYGLHIIPSSATTIRGLNMLTIGNRFLHNEAGNALLETINLNGFIANGFLGPDTDDSIGGAVGATEGAINFELNGVNSTSLYNFFLLNDLENNVGVISGDTTRVCIKEGNSRGTIYINNRIGSGYEGWVGDGAVRSTMFIQNYFTGLTRPLVVKSSASWLTFIGDNHGVSHRDVTIDGGSLNYLTFQLDRTNARFSMQSNRPMHLNEDGDENIFMFGEEATPTRYLKLNGYMRFSELASDPTDTPAAGERFLYAKAGGFFTKDSADVVRQITEA